MRRTYWTFLTATALLVLLAGGCSVDAPEGETIAPLEGELFFADYVAVGNSLTAGFMDSGLHMNGQMSSYPRLIAGQLGLDTSLSATAAWTQPWIADPGIGSTDTGDDALVAGSLHWDGAGITPLDVYSAALVPDMLLAALVPTPYSNLGVPGAALFDVRNAIDGETSVSGDNSFFDFILRNPNFGDTTQLQQCAGGKPTLVTLWIGNNDVLYGATGGDPQMGVNVTPPTFFASEYAEVVDGILAGVEAATGFAPLLVAANIPSITSIPFFIPELAFRQTYPFGYVEDDVSLVLFPALSWIAVPENQGDPLPGNLTLTADEVATVEGAVDAYNADIADICGARGVSVVDMHTLLATLDQPSRTHFVFLLQGGMDVASAAATTAFSLDGVHPNNRGYGIVANAFLEAINEAAGTDVPAVDTGALAWDPTYARPLTSAVLGDRLPGLSPRAAEAMTAVFRRP